MKIKALHTEGRQILYLDESWVDSNLTFKNQWQSGNVKGVCADENAGKKTHYVSRYITRWFPSRCTIMI
jgi:hypothetical protein